MVAIISNTQEQLIRLDQVLRITGLSKSSIYLFIKNSSFPKPIKIGKRAVAWKSSQIQNWIDGLSNGGKS